MYRRMVLAALIVLIGAAGLAGAASSPAAKRKAAACPAGTVAHTLAGKAARRVCVPRRLPRGHQGMLAAGSRALRVAGPLPKGGRRLRTALKAADRIAAVRSGPATVARRSAGALAAQLDGIRDLPAPDRSYRDDAGDLHREWKAVERLEGTDLALHEHDESRAENEVGHHESQTLTLTRKDGARGVSGHVTDDREARCPTAAGVVPGKVIFGITKGDSAVKDGKRTFRTVTLRLEGKFTGYVGPDAKTERYDLQLRGTTEVRGGVERIAGGRLLEHIPTRTFRTALDKTGIPIATDPVSFVREMRAFAPGGRRAASKAELDTVVDLMASTALVASFVQDRLGRKGDGRWYERRECATLDHTRSAETVRRGGTASWTPVVLAADGARAADGRWTARSACGALSPTTAAGSSPTFTLTDPAGAWRQKPYGAACVEAEVTSPAGRPRQFSNVIEPEPEPKRYRYDIEVDYAEDMKSGAAPTRMRGTGTVEDEEGGENTMGTGAWSGTEWDGGILNACAQDMGRTRNISGSAVVGAEIHDDGTVTIGWVAEERPLRFHWIFTLPVEGGTRVFENTQPFCGERDDAQTRATIKVRATPLG